MHISLTNIHFHYKKSIPVLRDIQLELKSGESLGLIGHNGSGKSSLLKIIGLLEKPVQGTYTLEGQKFASDKEHHYLKKIGVMIESPGLYPHLSVLENLKLFSTYYKSSQREIDDLLVLVNIKTHAHKKARSLSTGMKQRLGIAIALLGDPQLIILDEPSNGLDPEGIVEIRNLMIDLKRKGKSIIISSHHLSEVQKICDKVLILKNGSTLFYSKTDQLDQYKNLEDMYLNLSSL